MTCPLMYRGTENTKRFPDTIRWWQKGEREKHVNLHLQDPQDDNVSHLVWKNLSWLMSSQLSKHSQKYIFDR